MPAGQENCYFNCNNIISPKKYEARKWGMEYYSNYLHGDDSDSIFLWLKLLIIHQYNIFGATFVEGLD